MKSIINGLLAFSLIFLLGCGLKVGNLDVGALASASKDVLTGSEMSYEEQFDTGTQMAAIIVGSSKVHSSDKLQRYVNRVGQWVALHAKPETDKSGIADWQFIVIDTPDFNAFSAPGGYVIISSGAVDRLSSEAELAAVLAHEIVHVEQQHQVSAIEKSKTYSGLGKLAFTAVDYRQTAEGKANANYFKDRKIAEGLFNVTQNLYTKGLSREDELDADQKAVVLMTRAGYDPFAYLSVLQIVESVDAGNKTLLLATHPEIKERIHVAFNAINYVEQYQASTKVVERRFLSHVQ